MLSNITWHMLYNITHYTCYIIRTGERTNYNLRSSSQLLLQPYNATKTKKTFWDRAFQVASPGLWNGLPNDIRNAKTMDVFKSFKSSSF